MRRFLGLVVGAGVDADDALSSGEALRLEGDAVLGSRFGVEAAERTGDGDAVAAVRATRGLRRGLRRGVADSFWLSLNAKSWSLRRPWKLGGGGVPSVDAIIENSED